MNPLADRIRPDQLEDVVGQEHILGEGKILNRIIKSKNITNMIFYGPPGTGKTTVANIIAKSSEKTLYKLNATNASTKDIKDIMDSFNPMLDSKGILLYLDEIQNFNKKQQQALLEFLEDGRITLIASTTENPYFYIYNAILSRCNIFEFKPVNKKHIIKAINRAINIKKSTMAEVDVIFKDEAMDIIAEFSSGDVRKSINIVELSIDSTPIDNNEIIINEDIIKECIQKKGINYDKNGDSHYDILSAFQKSIRGSDPDAAIHYLGRLIMGGDLISICRRLLVISAEDIGLAYPQAITIVKACTDSAMQLGLPEARIPLAEAVIFLATAPKSNTAIKAIDAALQDIELKDVGDIPLHLKDGHYEGAKELKRMENYKYPHDYPDNYIEQQYLPDNIKTKKYYSFGNNKLEQITREFWDKIKRKHS